MDESEQERAIHEWRALFRGDTPVKDDTAVTDADIASSNLIFCGAIRAAIASCRGLRTDCRYGGIPGHPARRSEL